MSQAGRAAKKISPIAGVAAGLTVATAGVWAWRRKTPPAAGPERWEPLTAGVCAVEQGGEVLRLSCEISMESVALG